MSRCGAILSALALLFGTDSVAADADQVYATQNRADVVSTGSPDRPTAEYLLAVASDSPTGIALERIAASLSGSAISSTSLHLSVESNGSNLITAALGAEVIYEVVGMLSDDANEGLALVGFNLMFDGGDLLHAAIPDGEPTPGCDAPMINFTLPWGITNPDDPCPPACGFGGTIIDGDLVQVGGAQNTINNTPEYAPYPVGPVLTGVAQPSGCGPTVLATGNLIAPNAGGVYTLALTELFANVIREGETGEGFWATEAAGVGTITNLVIHVGSLAQIENVCLLPPVVGDCTGAFLRYFYDPCTAQCLTFSYGGCGGNANNFLTLEECQSICSPQEDVCSLPAEPGPCDGACPRFFHNICTGQCEPFLFGCCDGNNNNFLTLEECETACPPVTDVCSLPGVVGPCEAIIPRYYFNAVTGRCESFEYGGCDGNNNNFLTPEECTATCPMRAGEDVPTVSVWGMLALALLVMVAGSAVFRRVKVAA